MASLGSSPGDTDPTPQSGDPITPPFPTPWVRSLQRPHPPRRKQDMQHWMMSHHAHPTAVSLADRHYSRRTVGSHQMMPPGRKLVLVTTTHDAVWGISWPLAEYVLHGWPGAWVNTIFRNESEHLSSDLIREAVAITRWFFWPDVSEHGIVTFIDTRKVRKKRDWGRCYVKAGFTRLEQRTKGGHVVLQLLPDAMPAPMQPLGTTAELAFVS